MQTYKVVKLGNSRGKPRLWLEGQFPLRAGFAPGTRFSVMEYDGRLCLRISPKGERIVSRKTAAGKVIPVIDLNSEKALAAFKDMKALRVVMRASELWVMPLATHERIQAREARLLEKLRAGRPLATAGLAFGAGVLDHAIHTGLEETGIAAELAIANELREDLAEHAAQVNPFVTDRTVVLEAPMQEVVFDHTALESLAEVDVLVAGLPCSGASLAGRAKRSLAHPEEHPMVGHLVVAALAFIGRLNPSVVVLENVPTYARSASASILRSQLRDFGYQVHERELLGTDFGDLERRKRWCLVAVSQGIEFSLDSLTAGPFPVRRLADVLEPPEAVADRWSEMRGLKAKQERDAAAGKGFRMQVYDGSESSINTLTKGMQRNRSTDPKIAHPTNPQLLRIPTAREHARIKGVPETLIEGLSQTTAHEMLGQGICYSPFRALGRHIGQALHAFAEGVRSQAAGTSPAALLLDAA